MGFAIAVLGAALAFAQETAEKAPPDPQEIIRRSVAHDLINFERMKNYTYTERDEARAYDNRGRLKKTEVDAYEILILGGRDYARLIGRNDKPLPEKEARKEQEKMDREAAQREHESAEDKAKREKERQEERKFLNEVPEAFTFRLLGEESISGKPAWVITAEPKADYRPRNRTAKIIAKMRGTIWIDKSEYQWVRVEAEVRDKLSFGLRMVQIEPGATVHFEQARINDEIWLPASAQIHADARLALFKRMHSEVDIVFRDYKKFQADSHLVLAGSQ